MSEFNIITMRDEVTRAVEKMRKARLGGARSEIRRTLTKATKPLRTQIRDAARDRLPKAGGLNKWAAVMPGLLTDFRPDTQSVKIRDSKRGHDLKSIDEGRVRHPLYGDKNHWYQQAVAPGFFTDTVAARSPEVAAVVRTELEKYLAQIGR